MKNLLLIEPEDYRVLHEGGMIPLGLPGGQQVLIALASKMPKRERVKEVSARRNGTKSRPVVGKKRRPYRFSTSVVRCEVTGCKWRGRPIQKGAHMKNAHSKKQRG